MQKIETQGAPRPAGHYAQGIAYGGLVYVAGQLPIDPATGTQAGPHGAVAEQTERALRNVQAILEAGGSGLDRLLQVTIYVSDMEQWGEVNQAYARVMGEHRPARAVVPVKELHHGYAVEIQAIGAQRPLKAEGAGAGAPEWGDGLQP